MVKLYNKMRKSYLLVNIVAEGFFAIYFLYFGFNALCWLAVASSLSEDIYNVKENRYVLDWPRNENEKLWPVWWLRYSTRDI